MIALAPGDIVRFKGKHFLYTGYDGVQNNMVMPVVYGLDGERTCTMLVLHVAEAHRDALVGDYRATLLLAGNRIGWTWDGYVERDPMICPGDLITPVRDWIHLCKSVSPDGWLLNAMSPVWPSGSIGTVIAALEDVRAGHDDWDRNEPHGLLWVSWGGCFGYVLATNVRRVTT